MEDQTQNEVQTKRRAAKHMTQGNSVTLFTNTLHVLNALNPVPGSIQILLQIKKLILK